MDNKLLQLHKEFGKHTAAIYLGREGRRDRKLGNIGYYVWMCSCGAFCCCNSYSSAPMEWMDGLAAEEYEEDVDPLIQGQTPEIQQAWREYRAIVREHGPGCGQNSWLGDTPKETPHEP